MHWSEVDLFQRVEPGGSGAGRDLGDGVRGEFDGRESGGVCGGGACGGGNGVARGDDGVDEPVYVEGFVGSRVVGLHEPWVRGNLFSSSFTILEGLEH